MNKTEKLLKWIREVDVKTLPYNVMSIGWGPKIKNGLETNDYVLIFTVKEKKPLSEIKKEEIIPKDFEINLDDVEVLSFKTDVVEPILHQKLGPLCHLDSDTISPVREHRIRRRPLMGGIETAPSWGDSVATLGIFVKDKTDGQIVALSNSHVFASSQLSARFRTQNDSGSTNVLQISSYQPTGYWATNPENDYIGKCKRTVMIGDLDPTIIGTIQGYPIIGRTSCDAAILSLSSYTLIDSLSSPNILNFSVKAPYVFANDSEIDSLVPGGSNEAAPVFRSGRTFGPIGSPGNSFSCALSVYTFNDQLVGLYSGYVANFADCFLVRGNVDPGAGGDSGSAVFALFNQNNPTLSAWKLIGLLFAGPSNNSYFIGCRITNVAENLNITSWDTKIPNLSSSTNIQNLSGNYSLKVTLSGRTYYQVGFEN